MLRTPGRQFGLTAFLIVVSPCVAAPPAGVDANGPLHVWFEHQHSIIGSWCCNLADGHILPGADWRSSTDHYEVRIEGIWHEVPATALRDPSGGPNPTHRAVVWWKQVGDEIVILCFAPGTEL
jgi:hypothetical protein